MTRGIRTNRNTYAFTHTQTHTHTHARVSEDEMGTPRRQRHHRPHTKGGVRDSSPPPSSFPLRAFEVEKAGKDSNKTGEVGEGEAEQSHPVTLPSPTKNVG